MKPKILVIDDEKNTRDGLREALADDYDVLLAEDGTISRQHDDQRRILSGCDVTDEIHAVHTGHAQIRQRDADIRIRVQQSQSFDSVFRQQDIVVVRQRLPQAVAGVLFVIYY